VSEVATEVVPLQAEPPTSGGSEVLQLQLSQLDERYHRFRVSHPGRQQAMKKSLVRHGQLSPVVVTERETCHAVVDGFKRLYAARELGHETLSARCFMLSEQAAVAALYTLNLSSSGLMDFEEALIVCHLCRECGLSQVEVGQLLGRHKSWVSRRLSLIERLSDEIKDDLRVGLTSVTVAREVARLPRGNQVELVRAIHRDGLTTREATEFIRLFEETQGRDQQRYLLDKPREALSAQDQVTRPLPDDPRLGRDMNRLRRKLHQSILSTPSLTAALTRAQPVQWTDMERQIMRPLLTQTTTLSSVLQQQLCEVVDALQTEVANDTQG
jgi:ParB/RepB/Spo0J family partition protein